MKIASILTAFVATVLLSSSALAVPPGMKNEYAGGGLGKVTFDGKTHADAKKVCNDCHPKVFQMKKNSTKITMAEINSGKQCGTCHDGKTAFKAGDPANCTTCHKK